MIYDVAVIGSGPGGYVAAIRAAQLGLKVVCIEKEKTLGGTCLNVGCIPSKVLLHDTEVGKDFSSIMQRKDEVVSGFTKGIESLFQKNKIQKIQGAAKLLSPNEIQVGDEKIEAKNIILATGSVPATIPSIPVDEKRIVTSNGALFLKEVPKKMVVVGAGIIGVELGSVYARLGSEVTFVEVFDRICPTFSKELSKALQKSLELQKMKFHLKSKVVKVEGGRVAVAGEKEKFNLDADVVLVAVGRKPYSEGLGLDELGIEKDERGFCVIDSMFRTKFSNVYAIGDLVNGPMLAHKASEEGVAVAEIIAGKNGEVNYVAVPNVAYTHPEVASVGLSQEKIKEFGLEYVSSRFPFKANSRARCIDDDQGFIQIFAEKKSERILGVEMIGPSASELIAEATLAIELKATATQLKKTCFAHPTLSESFKEAALGLFQAPIHI